MRYQGVNCDRGCHSCGEKEERSVNRLCVLVSLENLKHDYGNSWRWMLMMRDVSISDTAKCV